MKVETHINGSLQLIVIPENDLETAILEEAYRKINAGKRVSAGVELTREAVAIGIRQRLVLGVEA